MIEGFLFSLSALGYFGVFLASTIGSATVIFPVPIFIIIFAAGAVFNPFIVGIVAGIGSAIGELVAYGVGFGGGKLLKKRIRIKQRKRLSKGKKWLQSSGGFFLVFIFAATPLPTDVIGIICGSIKYDIKKFFLACMLGKILSCLILAYAGFYGINWMLSFFGLGL